MTQFSIRLATSMTTFMMLAAVLVTTSNAFADVDGEYFTNILCRETVDAQLRETGATRDWSQFSVRELDGSRRFFSPTSVIGVWVEARVFMNREVEIRRITANFTEIRKFDLKTCKPKAVAEKQRRFFATPNAADEVFTDRDLRALISKHERGIIYIWSPNMPYSYRAFNERASGVDNIREVARKLNAHLTVVVDPAANQLFTRKLVNENRSLLLGGTTPPTRRAQSLELAFRSMNTHFPVVITYANGKIARHAYPGVGTEKEYTKLVSKQMAELAQ